MKKPVKFGQAMLAKDEKVFVSSEEMNEHGFPMFDSILLSRR